MEGRAAESSAEQYSAERCTDESVEASVEAMFREERGRLLASLVRRFGDLDLAEEVASEAVEAALVHWPVDGVPARPGAWLLTTARRKAVDRLRRDQVYAARLAILQVEAERADPASPADAGGDLPDERLQLFFTCAHPALPADDRGALTLRCLAGLTTPEVARAFLVPPATMAQRIVRAKRKIREARIPFRVPGTDELPQRLPGVLQVIYSIFTEGYVASSGPRLQRPDLAEEAIRLARILRRLLPGEREVAGLLGLMLLVHARREARTGPEGEIVLLEHQDRGLWDQAMIEEGRGLVVAALSGGLPGPYGVQAAISALHDEAVDVESTDWPQIVALYDVLLVLTPSPVVALNRAAAVAMRDGPEAGLALLDDLAEEPRLRGHHPYPATRADLLHRLGRLPEAAIAYREALDLACTEPERAHLRRRLAEIEQPG
ncbi:RNA polymerase subunit sigma-24 [Planotetraspora thailandica]|uniref:RNA polymerase subunit sigma-24 n=1 Tax=Planotetraspora thailandica TaxID=487172 RepID=A0A8J3UTV2_9ACTN|nr:RNA polymerase sigma factor [Planotetraspora thailandica]GII51928.1 RNA polymerase subunit sigma-24 [Planotetraspora thailandica]